LCRSHGRSAGYAALFVAASIWLSAGVVFAGMEYLIVPLGAGFVLVAPAFTVGFYVISCDLEAGRQPSLRRACAAWRNNPEALFAMGLATLLYLVRWLRFAVLMFALVSPGGGPDTQGMPVFPTCGPWCLGFAIAMGAVMAGIVFIFGAFSLPLVLERKIGLTEALATSVVAVVLNARAMAVWFALVAVFIGLGLAAWSIGLCITLPLIGHASWHAHQAVIRPAGG
jgi:uncharacterized membrane protein